MASQQLAYNETQIEIEARDPVQVRRVLSEIGNLISRPIGILRVDSITGTGNARTIVIQVTDRLDRPRPGSHVIQIAWVGSNGVSFMGGTVSITRGKQLSLTPTPAGTFATDDTGKLELTFTRTSGASSWRGDMAYLGTMVQPASVADWS